MPFLAKLARSTLDIVIPEEVEDGQDVFCPGCGGRMRPRGGQGERARHFFHVAGLEDRDRSAPERCPGAAGVPESERHRKLKSLAVSALRQRFEGQASIDACAPEVTVDVSNSRSGVDERRADALVRFSDRNPYFGTGVVIEVQYANEGKDVPQVTADYLAADFSVLWVEETDFAGDHLPTATIDDAFEQRNGTAYTPYHDDPIDVLDIDPTEWFWVNIPEDWTLEDPKPDCPHEFEHRDGGIRCIRCGTPIEYVDEIGEYAYGPPDREEVPRNVDVWGPREHSRMTPGPHIHRWEPFDHDRGHTAHRCPGCRAHRLEPPHSTIIDYKPSKPDWDGSENRR